MSSKESAAVITAAMIERGYFDESGDNDKRIQEIVSTFKKIHEELEKSANKAEAFNLR